MGTGAIYLYSQLQENCMVSICKSWCLHLGDGVHLQVMVLTNLKEEEVKVVVTQRAGQARQEYLTYHILYMIYISYLISCLWKNF